METLDKLMFSISNVANIPIAKYQRFSNRMSHILSRLKNKKLVASEVGNNKIIIRIIDSLEKTPFVKSLRIMLIYDIESAIDRSNDMVIQIINLRDIVKSIFDEAKQNTVTKTPHIKKVNSAIVPRRVFTADKSKYVLNAISQAVSRLLTNKAPP